VHEVVVTGDAVEVPQAAAVEPVVVFVRTTWYPVGATPVAGADQVTVASVPPFGTAAVTPVGADSVPVVPVPDPAPAGGCVQNDQAGAEIVIRATKSAATRTPRRRAAWRARG
jgi:hypothetical protein